MKKAIITGATGFIGARLVNMLLDNDITVIGLGRKEWREIDPNRLVPRDGFFYIRLPMDELAELPLALESNGFGSMHDTVFYNIAWSGSAGLSDLDVNGQMKNVAEACQAHLIANSLGCSKFVHVGTMEEPIAQNYLGLDYRTRNEFNRHVVYSLAKTASRNAIKANAYAKKISTIIATNSHVMGPHDYKDSFLQETLRKLKHKNSDLRFSTGEQFFDVISVHDCAEAYMLIGQHGKANSEYWIGSGSARPLREYVLEMEKLYPSDHELQFGEFSYNDISMQADDFSISLLQAHTGYAPKWSYERTVTELYEYL